MGGAYLLGGVYLLNVLHFEVVCVLAILTFWKEFAIIHYASIEMGVFCFNYLVTCGKPCLYWAIKMH